MGQLPPARVAGTGAQRGRQYGATWRIAPALAAGNTVVSRPQNG